MRLFPRHWSKAGYGEAKNRDAPSLNLLVKKWIHCRDHCSKIVIILVKKKKEFIVVWHHRLAVITTAHNLIQLTLNWGSTQVQTLLAACRRFAVVRTSDNGWKLTLSWRRSLSYRNQIHWFVKQINGLVSIW